MSDPAALVPVLGAFGLVAVVAFIWTENRTHYPRPIQVGRPHARVRKALAAHLDQWADDLVDGVVRWQDFASLTKHDVRELLYERGWFYRGQDMDGDGWPLYATRDPQLAESAEPPPSRYALLAAELQDAAVAGDQSVLLDMTPYRSLTRDEIAEAAARTGWRPGPLMLQGTAPRMALSRTDFDGT